MLISLDFLFKKYKIELTGILHVGMYEAEELVTYEKYISRNKILWIEAIKNKVDFCKNKFEGIIVENATVSDKEEYVRFNISNNGQSSSILELGTHKDMHPEVHYVDYFVTETKLLKNILPKYTDSIKFNFLNIDIQGAELKALRGLDKYVFEFDYIYLEVNKDYLYKECCLIGEIDEYLSGFGFNRVETSWFGSCNWGDAFYIKLS